MKYTYIGFTATIGGLYLQCLMHGLSTSLVNDFIGQCRYVGMDCFEISKEDYDNIVNKTRV